MNNTMSEQVLTAENLQKKYLAPSGELHVLRGLTFSLQRGELVALVGASGTGKSTLLHLCGLLDSPSAGNLCLLGQNVAGLADTDRTTLRRQHIGFVYQAHHLLPEFTALENVMLPQLIAGATRTVAATRAEELLNMVGLANRMGHRPAKLSGGEQQRVAIARALANAPDLLIADEPTGNLDPETGEQIYALFAQLAQQAGVCTLMATHNMDLANRATRILQLKAGLLA